MVVRNFVAVRINSRLPLEDDVRPFHLAAITGRTGAAGAAGGALAERSTHSCVIRTRRWPIASERGDSSE